MLVAAEPGFAPAVRVQFAQNGRIIPPSENNEIVLAKNDFDIRVAFDGDMMISIAAVTDDIAYQNIESDVSQQQAIFCYACAMALDKESELLAIISNKGIKRPKPSMFTVFFFSDAEEHTFPNLAKVRGGYEGKTTIRYFSDAMDVTDDRTKPVHAFAGNRLFLLIQIPSRKNPETVARYERYILRFK